VNLPKGTPFLLAFESGSRVVSSEKSIALMLPSPNSSWITSLRIVPSTLAISHQR